MMRNGTQNCPWKKINLTYRSTYVASYPTAYIHIIIVSTIISRNLLATNSGCRTLVLTSFRVDENEQNSWNLPLPLYVTPPSECYTHLHSIHCLSRKKIIRNGLYRWCRKSEIISIEWNSGEHCHCCPMGNVPQAACRPNRRNMATKTQGSWGKQTAEPDLSCQRYSHLSYYVCLMDQVCANS